MTTEAELNEQLTVVRQQLARVEEAAMNYLDVIQATGLQREAAHNKLVEALRTDFRTAVVTSADMTESQRDYWLGESLAEGGN